MDSLTLEHVPIAAQLVGLVLSVLAVGWGGFRWLRACIREEFSGASFREAVRAESIEALHTDDGQRALAKAVSPMAEMQNRAITDVDRRLSEQGKRIGELEQRTAAIEGRLLVRGSV